MTDELTAGDWYVIVRRAVRDARWDVLGDLFTFLLAGILGLLGVQLTAVSLAGGIAPPALIGAVVGLVVVGLGGYPIWREFTR